MIDGEMEYLGILKEEKERNSQAGGNTGIPAALSTLRIIVNQIFILCNLQFSQWICDCLPSLLPV